MRKDLEAWLRGEAPQTPVPDFSGVERESDASALGLLVASLSSHSDERSVSSFWSVPPTEDVAETGESVESAIEEAEIKEEIKEEEAPAFSNSEESDGTPESAEAEPEAEEAEEPDFLEEEPAAEELEAQEMPAGEEGETPARTFDGDLFGATELPEDDSDDAFAARGMQYSRPESPEREADRFTEQLRRIEQMRRVSSAQAAQNRISASQAFRRRMAVSLAVFALIVAAAYATYRHTSRGSYDALVAQADAEYAQARYESALQLYNRASSEYPGKPELLLGAARSSACRGRVQDAAAFYRSALGLMADVSARSGVLYEIGLLYASVKDWTEAQENFKQALDLDPTSYGAYFALGGVLEERGETEEALSAYKFALDLNPSSDAAREASNRTTRFLSEKAAPAKAVAQESDGAVRSDDAKPKLAVPQTEKAPKSASPGKDKTETKKTTPQKTTKKKTTLGNPQKKAENARSALAFSIEPLAKSTAAWSAGPLWRGFRSDLSIPSDIRRLADAVRLSPEDRDLYLNLSMAGACAGKDRKTMQALWNDIYERAQAKRQ